MKFGFIIAFTFAILAACSHKQMLHEPPRPTSVESAVDVRIHNVIAAGDVTFSIDDVEIYRFLEPSHYDFVLDSGRYMFAYESGGNTCHAEVMLHTGNAYVFNLTPDCVIEMQ